MDMNAPRRGPDKRNTTAAEDQIPFERSEQLLARASQETLAATWGRKLKRNHSCADSKENETASADDLIQDLPADLFADTVLTLAINCLRVCRNRLDSAEHHAQNRLALEFARALIARAEGELP